MELYSVFVWLHVLLFVFWLGADLGVFIAGWWVRNPSLSLGERMLLLKFSAVVDLAPRVCFVLMLPLGFTLARSWGLPMTSAQLGLVWLLGIAMLAVMFLMLKHQAGPAAGVLRKVNFTLLGLVGIGCFVTAANLLQDGSPLQAPWLGWKIAVYGVICFIAIGIDFMFHPVLAGFGKIAPPGASASEIAAGNELIRSGMNRTLVVVSTLYALLLVASFLGKVKPPL